MTGDPEAIVRLTRLRKELDIDLEALRARYLEVVTVLRAWDRGAQPNRAELIVTAVNLHGWYTALEHGLERVARLIDRTLPEGSTWHVELLEQMRVEVPELRPEAVPDEIVPQLHDLRKFRHFFRNAYVLELEAGRVRERIEDLVRAHPPVEAAWRRLLDHAHQVLLALRGR